MSLWKINARRRSTAPVPDRETNSSHAPAAMWTMRLPVVWGYRRFQPGAYEGQTTSFMISSTYEIFERATPILDIPILEYHYSYPGFIAVSSCSPCLRTYSASSAVFAEGWVVRSRIDCAGFTLQLGEWRRAIPWTGLRKVGYIVPNTSGNLWFMTQKGTHKCNGTQIHLQLK